MKRLHSSRKHGNFYGEESVGGHAYPGALPIALASGVGVGLTAILTMPMTMPESVSGGGERAE